MSQQQAQQYNSDNPLTSRRTDRGKNNKNNHNKNSVNP